MPLRPPLPLPLLARLARLTDAARLALPIALIAAPPLAGEARAATYTVTKTADTNDGVCNADCSLREAIQASTTVSGGIKDVIVLPAGLYRLTIPRGVRGDNSPGTGADGNLVVDTLLSIQGAGRDTTIIDARPTAGGVGVDRVLSLTLTGNLTLAGVTLRGGRTAGQGGGILSLRGQLELVDSAIAECSATGGGGGLGASNSAVTTITRSRILDNTSGPNGSGGGIQNIQATMTILESTISGNTALLSTGGGIMNIDQQARPNPPAILDIRRSTIVDNLAGDPAGTSLTEGVGGGLYNSSGRALLENSTVTLNEAVPSFATGFGVIPGTGRGGGVAHKMLLGDDPADGTTIVNSTIAYNRALTGWQLYGFITFKTAVVENTLVAAPPGAAANSNCASEPGASGIASLGGNLSSDASPCSFNTVFDKPPSTPPGLAAALADNGGPTWTIALLAGSAAIGGGSALFCPDTDQRGYSRNTLCDIGAVEFLPEPGLGLGAAVGALALAGFRLRRPPRRDPVSAGDPGRDAGT